MFEFEACEVFETKELTFVNDCFKYERNEEIGHYRQTLSKVTLQTIFLRILLLPLHKRSFRQMPVLDC